MLKVAFVLYTLWWLQHHFVPISRHHLIWFLLIARWQLIFLLLLKQNTVSFSHISVSGMEPLVNIVLVKLLSLSVPIMDSLVASTSSSSTLTSSGILVVSYLLNSDSAGLFPVVACGMDLYSKRSFFSSSLQFSPSAWAALMDFRSDLFCLSTSSLALGHRGVV